MCAATAVAWAGMRGIVTLAAALAIPLTLDDGTAFPYRDLILLCAFTTVLGTLVIQGLTLGPLIVALRLPSDDPVAEEVSWARRDVYGAGLAAIAGTRTPEADEVRREYEVRRSFRAGDDGAVAGSMAQKALLAAARARANDLRLSGRIGDEAFRQLEAELDWSELQASTLDGRV